MHPNFISMQDRDGAAFAVLESISDAFFALDLQWEFTYINSQAEFVLGYAREKLLGRTIWSVYPGLTGSEFEMQYRQAAQNQKAAAFTAFYPDHQRWYEVHVYPAIIGISVYFRNVTEQIDTQRALAEKIAKLEQIERSQAFQIALSEKLRQITDTSAMEVAASTMLARALDLDGASFTELGVATSDAVLASLSPDTLEQLRSGVHAIEGAQTVAVPLLRAGQLLAVVMLHHQPQRRLTVEEIALASTTAERTWTSINFARAQAELKAERDQSAHIFRSMSEGFSIISSSWVTLQINAAGLHVAQRSEGEVLGHTVWEVWPEIVGTEIETRFRRVMATRSPDAFEQQVPFSNGVKLWIELRLLPVLGGGMAVHYRDVTQRRQIEEQLREADRRKDEFLAMLAHELRNPLAPISAAADLLRVASADPERVRKSSDVISRQVRHLTSLVDDLLDVSRVTRGLVLLEKTVLDARRSVADALEQVQPLLDGRRHTLALTLPPQPAWILGDYKRMVQILTNLLNNAAKYTAPGGHISLCMELFERQISIVVSDNGIGMAPALTASAFELFAQAERTADRAQGGLGIGLALVRSLVELHDGEVSVFSEGLGQGSAFTVVLPRAPDGAQAAGHASSLRL